ncbi:MAG: CHAT domain-containing protein [Saprospiraceae bacterium]
MKKRYTLFLVLCTYFSLLSQDQAELDRLIAERFEQVSQFRFGIDVAADSEQAIAVLLATRARFPLQAADCKLHAKWYYLMGACLFELDRNEEALLYLKDSTLLLYEQCWGPAHGETAYIHYMIGRTYAYLGDHINRVAALIRALNIYEELALPIVGEQSLVYQHLANAFIDQGDYVRAQEYLQSAYAFYKTADILESENGAELLNSWGILSRMQGKYPEGNQYLQQALSILNRMNDPDLVFRKADIYHNLGTLALDQGSYDQGIAFANQALALNQSLDNNVGLALNLDLLGTLQKRKGNWQNAQNQYDEALRLKRQHSQVRLDEQVGNSLENLADLAMLRNEFTAAIQLYQAAIAQLIDQAENLTLFENPIIAARVISNRNDLLRVLDLKAQAYLQLYESQGAAQTLLAATETYQKIDTLLNQIRQGFQAGGSKYLLQEAIVPIYERAIQANLMRYRQTQALSDLEQAYQLAAKNKALVLLEGLQNETAKSFANIPRQLLRQEAQLKKDYYKQEIELLNPKLSATEQAQQQNRLFQLRRAYEKLIATLETDYPAYYDLKYRFVNSMKISDLQAKLLPDNALFEYFVGPQKLFVFVITQEGVQYFERKKPADLEEKAQQFRQVLQMTDPTGQDSLFSLAAYTLYEYLLGEPLRFLANKGAITRLKIIPDDVLLQLPFDVLLTAPTTAGLNARTAPYVIKQFAISYGYSNQLAFDGKRTLKRIKKAAARFGGFGLAYDDFTLKGLLGSGLEQMNGENREMGRLKYSDDEVIDAARILGGETWVNKQATKAAFLENADKYAILHLAMHALVDDKYPLNSAMIFSRTADSSDFMLKAADLYSLQIQADLAVLSACNTGFGTLERGEGVRSLARAFIYAGCHRLLATLWEASDHSTKDILLSFYHSTKAAPKQPIDVLLQKAKLHYLETAPPTFTLPNYWAHLMILGDAMPLDTIEPSSRWYLYLLLGLCLLFIGRFLFSRRSVKKNNIGASFL